MPKRKFFQYELNWLKKYGFDLDRIDSISEAPVEYVTGHARFLERDFLVTPNTLIPRIETEEIIPIATEFLSTLHHKHLNVADIGTGSGCIGISLAESLILNGIRNFDIYLTDISSEALEIAKQNSKEILKNIDYQLHFLNSNLLENIPPHLKFDLVTSNLPYIPTRRIKTLDSSVKDYEPISALDGGINGTTLINKLLVSIMPFLESRFMIILEIDSTHTLRSFSIPSGFTAKIEKDSLNRSRFLIITSK